MTLKEFCAAYERHLRKGRHWQVGGGEVTILAVDGSTVKYETENGTTVTSSLLRFSQLATPINRQILEA